MIPRGELGLEIVPEHNKTHTKDNKREKFKGKSTTLLQYSPIRKCAKSVRPLFGNFTDLLYFITLLISTDHWECGDILLVVY